MNGAVKVVVGFLSVLGLLALGAVLHDALTEAESDAVAEARADTLQNLRQRSSALRDSLSDAGAKAAADSAAIDSLTRRLERQNDSLAALGRRLSARAVAAGPAIKSSFDSVRAALPPPSRHLADTLEAQVERRDRTRLRQIETAQRRARNADAIAQARDSLASVIRRRERATDSLRAHYEDRIRTAERQIEYLTSKLDPPWWRKAIDAVPEMAGGMAAGAVTVCMVAGCGG